MTRRRGRGRRSGGLNLKSIGSFLKKAKDISDKAGVTAIALQQAKKIAANNPGLVNKVMPLANIALPYARQALGVGRRRGRRMRF